MGNQSVSDRVYHEIKNDILRRQYHPGERFPEVDFAKKYHCSRSTVKEVLNRLVNEGLVAHTPNKGAMVRKMSNKDMLDINMVLQAIEPQIARLAVESCTEQNIRKLKEIARSHEQQVKQLEPVKATLSSCAFKQCLAKITENYFLLELTNRYYDLFLLHYSSDISWNDTIYKGAYKQVEYHNALISAIEQKDKTRAAEIAARNVQDAIDMLLSNSSNVQA
jgi:DNA-binding GntR family transcriptional regulator